MTLCTIILLSLTIIVEIINTIVVLKSRINKTATDEILNLKREVNSLKREIALLQRESKDIFLNEIAAHLRREREKAGKEDTKDVQP